MKQPFTNTDVAAIAAYMVARGWRKRQGGQFMHSYEHAAHTRWLHLPIDTDKPWKQEHIRDTLDYLARDIGESVADVMERAINMKAIQ